MIPDAAPPQPATAVDIPSAGLDRLGAVAVAVINTHTGNTAGACDCCGLVWPCERARLAEHNLAAL